MEQATGIFSNSEIHLEDKTYMACGKGGYTAVVTILLLNPMINFRN
ncbi:MAG: hypothetical protein OXH65_02730 [Paracoccaceae bacterium]|nr:hypothetical protein [Paracoccaceae bacterium]MDE2674003.1 hypothetical protein [Paracoccaceae bacterium]